MRAAFAVWYPGPVGMATRGAIPPDEQSMRSTPSACSRRASAIESSTVQPSAPSQSDQERPPVGPHAANGPHDLEQKANSVVEGPAPEIVSPIRDGRQKLVNQVAVGGVNLDDVEARVGSPGRRGPKRFDDAADVVVRQRLGRLVSLVEGNGAGGDDRAPADRRRQRLAALPRSRHRGLAPRVRQLDPGGGAVCPYEAGDPRQRFDLFVLPKTEILGADATARLDRGRFGHHQASATDGAAAEMNQVPVVGEAVRAGVLAHRGDADPVSERHAAQGERFEEHGEG
jgi:hypothetical protein